MESKNQPQQFLATHASPSTTLSPQTIDALFLRMQAIYGHRWSSQWPTPELMSIAKAEWGKSLAKFSGIMSGALERCKKTYAEFPPTLPQFVELCTPTWYEQMDSTALKHEPQNVITEEQRGKKEFTSMLNRLNLKPN